MTSVNFNSYTPNYSVNLTDKVDPDIVIINIEEGDREFIGQVLLTIDSCKPKLIGIDAVFVGEKDHTKDSILINALNRIDNVILGYTLDSMGQPLKSHEKFRSLVSDEGLAVLNRLGRVSIDITPLTIINEKVHELFPLTIIKRWKPGFMHQIETGKSIPIKFTRTLDQFVHFNGSELTTKKHYKDLNNKVVLLGYLGPLDVDKHFTPIRTIIKYGDDEPDTYGVVILANQIQTILNYKN